MITGAAAGVGVRWAAGVETVFAGAAVTTPDGEILTRLIGPTSILAEAFCFGAIPRTTTVRQSFDRFALSDIIARTIFSGAGPDNSIKFGLPSVQAANSCRVRAISDVWYGLLKKRPPFGRALSGKVIWPDVTINLIGGHRSRTA